MLSSLPWYARMAGKIVLARVPLGYRAWRRLSLFAHGDMASPEYAYSVFRRHFDAVAGAPSKPPQAVLELGPGDSVASALIARALGVERSYLVDSGDFATREMAVYRGLTRFLDHQGLHPVALDESSFEAMLSSLDSIYLTAGLESLATIPDDSVDLIFSQAVMEHVRLDQFDATTRELRRIVRSTGVISHQVDLRDHLGGGLNNLRFTPTLWESQFFARSGFYTNRIRFSEMLERFRLGGFDPTVVSMERWASVPTSRASLNERWASLPDEELTVLSFQVLLRPV